MPSRPGVRVHPRTAARHGIGPARLEFVIKNAIAAHPKALLNYGTIDAETKALIDAKMVG